MGKIYNLGKADYSDMIVRYVRYKWRANEPCICALSNVSYFCLNTAQYIVEYSDVNSE